MSVAPNFINIQTRDYFKSIWDFLNTDGWKNIQPENFEYNNLLGVYV